MGKRARPALAATVPVLYHMLELVRHASAVVSYYATGFLLCILSSLRVRDAQRANVRFSGTVVDGMCFTSKHPKRRAPKPMPFFAPKSLPCEALHVRGEWYRALQERGEGFDYLFPRVQRPRGAAVDDGRVRFLPGPASSSYVIKLLRLLLTLPPPCVAYATAGG